jgi:hypothetical protein
MRPLPQSGNLAIRPSIRVLGAILMLALAYVFVEGAMPLFQAEHTVYGYRSCGGGKGLVAMRTRQPCSFVRAAVYAWCS